MSKITYKNLHVKERRFRTNGNYQVFGESWLDDELVKEESLIAEFMLLKSADRFIEIQNGQARQKTGAGQP